jgi:hypothetical protein
MIIAWILASIVAFFVVWTLATLVYLKWYFAKIPPGQRTIVISRWFG